ncbi:MAG: helix-turn-helix domain-containing protein [Acidovorax sp.]|nr:helix-turn-helix domain-containing protein [Acidovorax sp.]
MKTALPSVDMPHYHKRHSGDVDEHATHISAWRQEYDQLSCGHFDGMVRELLLDGTRLQVFHEFTSQQTSQRCQPWSGSVWFGIPDGIGAGALHFSGRLQGEERQRVLLTARAQEGFLLCTPRRFGIYGVVIDEQWLGARFGELGLRGPLPQASGVAAAELPPHRHVALCQTLESMLSLGASGEASLPWAQQALRLLGEQLVRLLGECGADVAPAAGVPGSVQRRLAMVMAARGLVADPCNHLQSVDELCQRLHLTPRTLHNHFQSTVGESPSEFLRAVRLNACRRRLRGTADRAVKVQDVAAQWGFFHMGRFSQDYKDLFGELPSQTLRQARAADPCLN